MEVEPAAVLPGTEVPEVQVGGNLVRSEEPSVQQMALD